MRHILLFLFSIKILQGAKYSNTFPKCQRSGTDVDECLTNSIGSAFSQICTKGIPELNVLSFDPYLLAEMTLRTEGSSINLVQKYLDMKIYGYCDGKISDVHFDNDKKTLKFTFLSPKVENIGKYDVDGQVLLIKLKASGDCNQTLINFKMDHIINFEETTKGKDTYFNVKSYDLHFAITRAHIYLEKLFEDEQINNNVLKVFNENWEPLWEDTKHPLEYGYSELFKAVASRFFKAVPVNQIFLD